MDEPHDSAEQVHAMHEAFYRALNQLLQGDPAPMASVWSHSDRVTAAHPMGHWAYGWEQVWTTWVEFALVISDGQVRTRDLQIRLYGDFAYTTCTEEGTINLGGYTVAISANATNIYHREADGWKLIHHHADKSPAAERIIDRLTD